MAGDKATPAPAWLRTVSRIGIVAVLAAFAGFLLVKAELTEPREGLCDQGRALRQARLLNKARTTYLQAGNQGDNCDAGKGKGGPPVAAIEREQVRSEMHLTEARLSDRAGRKWPAIRSYVAGLSLKPFNRAGSEGLRGALKGLPPPAQTGRPGAAARIRCRLALRLTRAGLLNDARTALAGGLPLAPRLCRPAGRRLARRSAHAASLLRAGRRLDGEGETGSSRELFARALRVDSDLREARPPLEASLNGESRLDLAGSRIADIPGALKTALAWFLPLAAILLALAVGLWYLVRELAVRSAPIRKLVQALGRPRVLSFLHRAATPEVIVDDFEGSVEAGALVGKDFSALVSETLPDQMAAEPTFAFDRVSKGSGTNTAGTAAAQVLTEIPETKLLGGMFELAGRLFRRHRVHISGHLCPVGDLGAGVTLTVTGTDTGPSAGITLWEKWFDPLPPDEGVERWLRLAPVAAVWARWQLASVHGSFGEMPNPEHWKADAQFGAGLAWQAMGQWERADKLYADAIESDPRLLPAAHNMALIEVRLGRYEPARKRLERLRKALEEAREKKEKKELKRREFDPNREWPTLDTASLYTLSLALGYPAVIDLDGPQGAREEAVDTARELVGALSTRLQSPDKYDLEDEDVTELEGTVAPSVVLLASLTIRADAAARTAAIERIGQKATEPTIKRKDLDEKALEKLQPWELVERYVLRQKHRTRRTYYNLACYYTTLAEYTEAKKEVCQDLAVAALSKGLEGRGLEAWAREDPSLATLRHERPEDFGEIVEENAIAPHGE